MNTTRANLIETATKFALRAVYFLARGEWDGARLLAESQVQAGRLQTFGGLTAPAANGMVRLSLVTAFEALYGREVADRYARAYGIA